MKKHGRYGMLERKTLASAFYTSVKIYFTIAYKFSIRVFPILHWIRLISRIS